MYKNVFLMILSAFLFIPTNRSVRAGHREQRAVHLSRDR